MTNVHRKKRAALCITAVAACLSLSVGCGNTWNQTYGGPESDEARCVLPVATGGFVAAGSTNSFGSGGSDAWMVGTDVWGNALWNVAIGGEADDHARSIEQTNEGGFILAGRTSSSGAGGEDAWLVKTDSGGNEQWSATFGGTGDDRADSLVQTADGGYLLAGSTASAGAGGLDGWVVMADPDGNGVWSETFGGPLDDQLRCIRQTADGGYIMAGQTNSCVSGGRDAWLIKLDAARGEEWSRT